MLASLNGQHPLGSAVGLHTFQPQHDLLCGFGLLPENWLRLPTVATALPIIAPLPLGIQGILALLILGHFVRLMLSTLLTVSSSGFRHIYHLDSRNVHTIKTINVGSLGLNCCGSSKNKKVAVFPFLPQR